MRTYGATFSYLAGEPVDPDDVAKGAVVAEGAVVAKGAVVAEEEESTEAE
jgi:hypothetical protein